MSVFTLRDMAFLVGSQGTELVSYPRTTEAGNQRITEANNIRTTELGVVSSSTLLSGLVAWYNLNETSGNRANSHMGGYTLTQSGTVGSIIPGKVGAAARWSTINSANNLSSTSNIFSVGSNTIYFALWVMNQNHSGGKHAVFSKWDSLTNNREFQLIYNSYPLYTMSFSVSTNGITSVTAQSGQITVINEIIFVEAYINPVTGLIGVAKNGEAFSTVSYSGTIFNGTAPFYLGRNISYVPPAEGNSNLPMHGWIDELAIWNRMLTTEERATLYSSGNGMAYPG